MALRDERVTQLLPEPQVVQAALWERQASQPLAAQSWDAQRERAFAERKPEPAVQAGQAWPAEARLMASPQPLAVRDAPVAQRQLPSSA